MVLSSPRTWSAAGLVIAGGALLALPMGARGGGTDAFWSTPAPGVWSAAARWSTDPLVPNNNMAAQYNAFLRVGTAAYTVDLDIPVRLNDLTIDAPAGEATLRLNAFNMDVEETFIVANNNSVRGDGAGQLTINGTASYSIARFYNVPRVRHRGPAYFISPNLGDIICDTDFEHEIVCEINGNGTLSLEGDSVFTTLPGAELQLRNDAAIRSTMGAPSIVNQGTLSRDAGGGTATIDRVALDNRPGAMLRVSTGTLLVTGPGGSFTNDGMVDVGAGRTLDVGSGASLTNLAAGTLSGGAYRLAVTFRVDTGGTGIDTLDTDLTLDGPASALLNSDNSDALANTDTLSPNRTLTLKGARDLTTGGSFTNQGTVAIEAGSDFAVPAGSDLNGFGAGGTRTLTGGRFEVAGALRFDAGPMGIDTVDTQLILKGDGAAVLNAGGASALANTDTVGTNGSLELLEGKDLTTGGSFTVAAGGSVVVDTGSVFEVPNVPGNRLTNFDGGFIADGSFEVRGIVRAPDLAVQTIGRVGSPTSITLDGVESSFQSFTGDAFGALSTIEAGSTLGLANGRALTVTGTLTTRGTLRVSGAGPALRGGSPQATTLRIEGDYAQDEGRVELGGGVLEVGGIYDLRAGALVGFGVVDLTLTSATRGGADVLLSSGVIDPGVVRTLGGGRIEIDGGYTQRPGASLKIDLGGVAPVNYDVLAISGLADLDGPGDSGLGGRLDVGLINGFVPQIGQFFDVMFYASREGSFASYTGMSLPNGLILEAFYLPDRLRLVVNAPSPGAAVALGLGLVWTRGRRARRA